MPDLHQNGVANSEPPASDRRTEMARDDAQPKKPDYPSQGVPTKIDRRVLPLLRMLKEWSGIKQYRMVMTLVVNEVRAHPELVAALPPDYLEGLQGLEEVLVLDQQLYAGWQARATNPDKGKKKT